MTTDFTLGGYRALLEAFLDRGYTPRSFADVVPTETHLVLRHDLDMSLDAAVPIAEIERGLGISATYFVLLRSEMYNPSSNAGTTALRHLVDNGHNVGLHFDATLYPADPENLDNAALKECAALEAIIETPVETVSFHRPIAELLGRKDPIAGRRHAYEPRFFSEMGYCSDSRGDWHHGHPLAHEAVSASRALQLLTHPIWWARESRVDVQDNLEAFAADRYNLLRQELGRNCEAFDPLLPAKPFVEDIETGGQ